MKKMKSYGWPDAKPIPANRSKLYLTRHLPFLLERQGGLCSICNQPLKLIEATVDHHVPKSKGGSRTDLSNLRAAHKDCNNKKADKIPSDIL